MKRFLLAALMMALVMALAGCATRGTYVPGDPGASYMAASARYLKENLTPMPEGWSYQSWAAPDGTTLRWGIAKRASKRSGARATALFIPGYGGTLEIYGDILAELVAEGYQVAGYEPRGQGGSDRPLANPEKPYIEDFKTHADDLAAFAAFLEARTDGPLIIVGESMGGHIALRAAGEHPDLAVDAMVLLAPAVRIRASGLRYGFSRAIVEANVGLGLGEAYAPGQHDWEPWEPDLTSDNPCGTHVSKVHMKDAYFAHHPEARVAYGPTNQWLAAVLDSSELLMDESWTARIALPTIVLTVDDDRIVDTAAAERLCTDGLPDCKLVEVAPARHCIALEAPEKRHGLFEAMNRLADEVGRRHETAP